MFIILGVIGWKPYLKWSVIPYLPRSQWSSALSDQKNTDKKKKLNKYNSRSRAMWPQDYLVYDLSVRVATTGKTKLIFIIHADTHPIFLPVRVQAVVYCLNNIAPAQRTGTKSWCGLLNRSIQNICQHNNPGFDQHPILHQLSNLFCTCRNIYLCLTFGHKMS